MFVDEAEIYIRGGKGGDGCVSFRRERFVPKGGPDGGDGGNGGSVFAVADPAVETLLDFAARRHWIAENGRPGMGKNRTGRSGSHLILALPPGTLLFDRESGVLIKDLAYIEEPVCIARGGKGGRGNTRFARADHQTPREVEAGTAGEERHLRLELKLIADVGIVGLPNAGKSTLLSRMSHARPKIADYPFTSLQPCLGIVQLADHRRFVMADIPGLIEGAHDGAGLGDAFLKHIERTRVILHLIDVGSPLATVPPAQAYRTIRNELERYSGDLARKVELVAANKMDLVGDDDTAAELSLAIGKDVLPVSAVSGKGVTGLAERLWDMLALVKKTPTADDPPSTPLYRLMP
ncbi:MAG: GTPase ObgE [Phycisphaerae bacterium]